MRTDEDKLDEAISALLYLLPKDEQDWATRNSYSQVDKVLLAARALLRQASRKANN